MTRWLHLLPCTSVELAAELDTTVRRANARLQTAKAHGLVKHGTKRGRRYGLRGPCPVVWVRA